MWIQKVAGGGVEGLAYSPDGATLYTSDRSGWITAWDATSREGRRIVQLNEIERCNPIRLYTLAGGFLLSHGLHWIVWDIERKAEHSRVPVEFVQGVCKLASTRLYSRSKGSVITWEFHAARPGPVIDGWNLLGTFQSFDLDPDGNTAVLTDTHGYVTLFDLENSQELDRFEPQFRTSQLQGARFTPGGDTILLTAQQRVRLWDIRRRAALGEMIVLPWSPVGLQFHPTARMFATLNRESMLTLFSLDTCEPIRSFDFALGTYVQCICFSPDGLTCAVGGSNKQFAVFDVDV
jgi:WD40 repeat protein